MREKIGAFSTELHARTAYSSLHNYGGTLHDLDRNQVTGVEKAIANADLVAAEIQEVLAWVREIRRDGLKTEETTHG